MPTVKKLSPYQTMLARVVTGERPIRTTMATWQAVLDDPLLDEEVSHHRAELLQMVRTNDITIEDR